MTSRFTYWVRSACAGMALLALLAGSAAGALTTGSENVSGSRATAEYTHDSNTYGPFGWNYSYTRSFDGEKFTKHLEIDFDFDAGLGWDDTQKNAYKANAEAAIEGQWNNKFKIKDNNTGISYPLTVDMTTTGPFNQTVEVEFRTGGNVIDPINNPTPTTMSHWHSDETAQAMAHEFGHMLGLFDEYIGGAVNQYPDPLLSNDGLMGLGALLANPVMYPRYYQQYLDYMYQLNSSGSFSLIPEPASWLLLTMGLVCVAALRRRAA